MIKYLTIAILGLVGAACTGSVPSNEIIVHNLPEANGYDVRLGKSGSGIRFGIGKLTGRAFEGPVIFAEDRDQDGIVDDYSCLECRETDLSGLANTNKLSDIEWLILNNYHPIK